ncbi:hypothetical protein [Halosimplex salinum]|uniref:hypothetical protein n=1 Tax=Halosimplex salinum TaxID=1710538 RepID=UPI000F49428C|nr:hypothetical protein [Halosimplex salinum]
MKLRTFGLALAAGVAVFLVVGVAVTEAALQWIEFSLFVGLPVGLVAGVTAAALVLLGVGDEVSLQRRRAAVALGVFGVVFLAVLVVVAGVFSVGTLHSLSLATAVGLLAGIGSFALDPGETSSITG